MGLAKQVTTLSEVMKSGCGARAYLSPEMVRGAGYTAETDMWALGCTIYSLCACKAPFEAEDPDDDELAKRICELPPDRIPPPYSDELNEILLSMLQKDPGERTTARQALSRIEELQRSRQTGTVV